MAERVAATRQPHLVTFSRQSRGERASINMAAVLENSNDSGEPPVRDQRDADAVLDAGWDQDDLALAVAICALFNFMNRMVHGLGIEEDPEYTLGAGARLKERGYSGSSQLSKEQRDAYTSPTDWAHE